LDREAALASPTSFPWQRARLNIWFLTRFLRKRWRYFKRRSKSSLKSFPIQAPTSHDLAVQFCKLYTRVDNVWGTIWLKYKLRPIHERLLGTNSVYCSAWSQIQVADESHQWATGAAPLTRNYAPSDGTGLMSENWRVLPNENGIIPTGGGSPLDDTTVMDYASVVSLFQPPTNQMAMSVVLSLGDPEMEPIPVPACEQAEARTVATPEQIPELSAGIGRGSGEALEEPAETTAVPYHGRA